jgi:hypothetical protein
MSSAIHVKLITIDIAVIDSEVSIIGCKEHKDEEIHESFYAKRLVINNKTSKEDIIKGIKDKIKENENPEQTGNITKGTVRKTNDDNAANAESSNNKPTSTQYTKYEPDDAYKGIKNDPNKYTPKDVMIYLSEIRRENKGDVPEHLQTLHDKLYNKVALRVNENNTEWQNDSETKKILLNIRDIDKSKSYRFYSSYEAIKSKLDIAFKNILSNNAVPAVYLTALTSMKKAIDSHTDFKYVDKVIFDNEHFYKSDTLGYSNMKNLTNHLNNTIFERFTGNEQISVEENGKTKYPPSIKLKGFYKKCIIDKKKISFTGFGNRKDECFKVFKNTSENEVCSFLEFISTKTTGGGTLAETPPEQDDSASFSGASDSYSESDNKQ